MASLSIHLASAGSPANLIICIPSRKLTGISGSPKAMGKPEVLCQVHLPLSVLCYWSFTLLVVVPNWASTVGLLLAAYLFPHICPGKWTLAPVFSRSPHTYLDGSMASTFKVSPRWDGNKMLAPNSS